MFPISAVIITFNEEKNIHRCLESLKGVAEEIVVVDSLSTDRTGDICKEMGARFIQNAWPGYVEQKNFGNAKASYDFILSIDADEALSEELRKSIIHIKNNPDADAWEMNRMTNYCGKWIRHGSWYPDRKLRLFNRNKGSWGGGKIHEIVEIQGGTKVGRLKGDLLHYSYHSISEHIKQANHFTDLTAEAAFQSGKRAGIMKILFSPFIKFIRDYIFLAGFLDGYSGYIVCRISAQATFMKYVKLRQLGREENKKTSSLNET